MTQEKLIRAEIEREELRRELSSTRERIRYLDRAVRILAVVQAWSMATTMNLSAKDVGELLGAVIRGVLKMP